MIKRLNEIIDFERINLKELEEARKKQFEKNKKIFIIWIVSVIIASIAIFIVALIKEEPVFIVVGPLAGGLLLYMKKKQIDGAIKLKIKNDLIKKLVRNVNESINFEPYLKGSPDYFKKSQLFKKWNFFIAKDFFGGEINDIRFKFFDLTLKKEIGSGKFRKLIKIFQGPFFVVDFKHTFQGKTIVVPETTGNYFGDISNFFRKMIISKTKKDLINIDYELFEKIFSVYSDNEEESKNILQNNLCNLLINEKNKIINEIEKNEDALLTTGKQVLQSQMGLGNILVENKSNKGVFFSCIGNKFYFGLSNYTGIFKIDVKQVINEESLKKYYDEFVNYLNLILNIYSFLEENMYNSDSNNLEQAEEDNNKKNVDF